MVALVFQISESGEVTVSVEGAQGSSCEKLTEPFEKALGVTASRIYKDSYFTVPEQTSSQETSRE